MFVFISSIAMSDSDLTYLHAERIVLDIIKRASELDSRVGRQHGDGVEKVGQLRLRQTHRRSLRRPPHVGSEATWKQRRPGSGLDGRGGDAAQQAGVPEI